MVSLLITEEPLHIDEPRILTVVSGGRRERLGQDDDYRKDGLLVQRIADRKVVLGAADTFRAAAIDQLKIWGERAGVDVIAHAPGADPGAVVFDAIRASQESRQADLLIVDTAGRLQTKYNLMKELEKIKRVAASRFTGRPTRFCSYLMHQPDRMPSRRPEASRRAQASPELC